LGLIVVSLNSFIQIFIFLQPFMLCIRSHTHMRTCIHAHTYTQVILIILSHPVFYVSSIITSHVLIMSSLMTLLDKLILCYNLFSLSLFRIPFMAVWVGELWELVVTPRHILKRENSAPNSASQCQLKGILSSIAIEHKMLTVLSP